MGNKGNNCMKMVLCQVLTVMLLCSVATQAFSSDVTRVIKGCPVEPGGTVEVDLVITVDEGINFYGIEEGLPEGWTVIDPGTGNTETPGQLSWLVVQDAVSTTETYILQAPDVEGTGVWQGLAQFEGDTDPRDILGDSQCEVIMVTGERVTICHIPPGNPAKPKTLSVGAAAVPAHLAHGDTLGQCP